MNMTQSGGLRARHIAMHNEGRTLIDDSSISESNLNGAMVQIIQHAQEQVGYRFPNANVTHLKKITLYDLQCEFFKSGCGGVPDDHNKTVFIRPDGGIITVSIDGTNYPLLIAEDKVQGTNDLRMSEHKNKQATGNAIERGAKNIRTCEMLCAHLTYFPYLLFASGCDFHSSETISKRIEMMNMGTPNHYIELSPNTINEEVDLAVDKIVHTIDIRKKWGNKYCIATALVKAHKWDEMPHRASLWKKEEYVRICNKAIDKAIDEIIHARTNNLLYKEV